MRENLDPYDFCHLFPDEKTSKGGPKYGLSNVFHFRNQWKGEKAIDIPSTLYAVGCEGHKNAREGTTHILGD